MTPTPRADDKFAFEIPGFAEALVASLPEATKALAIGHAAQASDVSIEDQDRVVSSESACALFGGLAENLLKLCSDRQDQLALFSTNLDPLVKVPLLTGIRAATESLIVESSTDEESAFRGAKLRFAIEQFELALTHMPAANAVNCSTFLVLLLKGLCYREILGAQPFARLTFKGMFDVVSSELKTEKRRFAEAQSQAGSNRDKLRLELGRADSYTLPRQLPPPLRAFVARVDATALVELNRHQYIVNAKKHESEAIRWDAVAASLRRKVVALEVLRGVISVGLT